MAAKTRGPKRDVYQEVTDRIISALEAGVGPWVVPHNALAGFPVNATSGRKYNGINVFLLYLTAQDKGYASNRWATFKQAKAAGTHVRKGEKSTLVIFWKFLQKQNETTGKMETIPMIRHYNVFNIEQMCPGCDRCKGISDKLKGIDPDAVPLTDTQRLDRAEETLAALKAAMTVKVKAGGAQACYVPSLDEIRHPEFSAYKSAEGYYSTLFHEFGHATAHASRLDRDKALGNRFGDRAYAMEELVAEMTSAFMCASLEIENNLQHPEYIGNWITVLKGDKRAIFTAQSQAKKAHAFLLDKAGISDEPEEGEEGEA